MFLLQKRRKAAFSWSPFDSDMVRSSRPAADTDRLRLSASRLLLVMPTEAVAARALLPLPPATEVSATILA